MASSENIFALDLGTTKFCLLWLSLEDTVSTPVIRRLTVVSQGMKRGMVSDIGAATEALRTLVDRAEEEFGVDVRSVYTGIAGSHLKSSVGRAKIDLGGRRVTREFRDQVVGLCLANRPESSSEVLHNVPLSFQIDSREPVDNPDGFAGDILSAETFIIEADRNYVRDVIKLCNNSGLQVSGIYAEPYASAMVTVPVIYRENGVLIADIGGGTTDGIIFRHSKPVKLFTINIGGKLMTADLAQGLRVSESTAESIKCLVGISGQTIDHQVPDLDGNLMALPSERAQMILTARITELLEMIRKETGPFFALARSGAIFTGGGSALVGLVPFSRAVFKNSVKAVEAEIPASALRIGLPQNHVSRPEERVRMASPYATACGILYLAVTEIMKDHERPGIFHSRRYLKAIVNWIKELT
jgi:cell division protein FtsA